MAQLHKELKPCRAPTLKELGESKYRLERTRIRMSFAKKIKVLENMEPIKWSSI